MLPSLDPLHLPALILTPQGRVLRANARLERLLGLPKGLLAGREFAAVYRDPADRNTLLHLLSAAKASGDADPAEQEFYLPGPDGERLPVLVQASLLAEGDAAALLVTFTDLTRVREAEQALRQQFAYVTELSDTALEQAVALKRGYTAATEKLSQLEGRASELQEHASALEEHARELETVNRELERRVARRTADLRQANLDAIYMLAVASEAKDEDTGLHVRRIRRLTEKVARKLGFSEQCAYDIGLSAVLHDVGKIHVPDAVLGKPGALTPDERTVMQQHTLWGERILPDRPFFKRARLIARSHHERLDGTGYPDGLTGEAIPVEARIVHVVDVYDALTHARVYKPAWPRQKAEAELRSNAGKDFDRQVVEAVLAATSEPDPDDPAP